VAVRYHTRAVLHLQRGLSKTFALMIQFLFAILHIVFYGVALIVIFGAAGIEFKNFPVACMYSSCTS
jgi:hypothetical protein